MGNIEYKVYVGGNKGYLYMEKMGFKTKYHSKMPSSSTAQIIWLQYCSVKYHNFS